MMSTSSSRSIAFIAATSIWSVVMFMLLLRDNPPPSMMSMLSSMPDESRSLIPIGSNHHVYSWDNGTDRKRIKQLAQNVSVTLIHVGKTGGGSVKKGLRKVFPDFFQIHRLIGLDENLKDRNVVMIIRDPLRRFESAFKWAKYKYERGMLDHHYGLNLRRHKKIIEECFPSLSYLGEHCLDDTPCGRALQYEIWANSTTFHLGVGIQFYLQHIPWYDNKTFQLIEAEQIAMDFNRVVSNILGIRVNVSLGRTHSEYPGSDDYIPEEYHDNIRQLLHEEYRVYYEVKQKFGARYL